MTDKLSSVCPELLSLRSVQVSDLAFLASVYAASRAEEMALVVGWSDSQKSDFLQSQFNAQHSHYQSHFPRADYKVILVNQEPVGRFYVDRSGAEIRLMDIALLPQFRGQGIGTLLVKRVLAEVINPEQWVSLHVEDNNPAKKLYQRLGFSEISKGSVYTLMHWHVAD